MARAPYQVIVFPFLLVAAGEPLFAIFRRREPEMWQAIAGGGEDTEAPAEAALRETLEESGIAAGMASLVPLDSRASIPAVVFSGTAHWGEHVFVVPEYSFGLEVSDRTIRLSAEHREFAWLPFQLAQERLSWDSNKVALWELSERIRRRVWRG